MAERTNIEWADSTLNIWEGCQETASPACIGCYARERNRRYAPEDGPREADGKKVAPNWGPHAPRREVKSWRSTLRKISRLAAAAFAAGRTEAWFVFVNSLSDFWDNQADPKLRAEALAEFRKHPHLTFLLLTKRPGNIVKLFSDTLDPETVTAAKDGLGAPLSTFWPPNAAIGCTVVNQEEADRDIRWLLKAKQVLNPAFAFLSMEPLASPVDLTRVKVLIEGQTFTVNVLSDRALDLGRGIGKVDWVIAGGGTDQGKLKADPMAPAWPRALRDQCAAAGVPFLFKQWGEYVATSEVVFGPISKVIPMEGGTVSRVGKKAAGRLLDGVEHNARPAVA